MLIHNYRCFKELQCFITDGKMTPWAMLSANFSLAKYIGSRTQQKPDIMWSEDGEVLTFGSKAETVRMSEMKEFIQGYCQKAQDFMVEHVLLGLEMESFEGFSEKYPTLVDQVQNKKTNYSFLSEEKNFPGEGENWTLLARFMREKEDHFEYINPSEEQPANSAPYFETEWRPTVIRTWYKNVHTLLQFFAVLTYWLYGPPGRGTELCDSRFRNISGRDRHIIILDSLLCFLGQYNKTTYRTLVDKLIARAVPDIVGKLIVFYLVYIRPLEMYWAPVAFPNNKDLIRLYESYLWVSNERLWTTDDFTVAFKAATGPGIGVELGFADWRDVAIAVLKKHLRIYKLDGENIDDILEGLHTGHRPEVSQNNYAVSMHLEDSTALIRELLNTCHRWHKFWLSKESIPQPVDDNSNISNAQLFDLMTSVNTKLDALLSGMSKLTERVAALELTKKQHNDGDE
jgi:hypothetical protein